MGTVIVDAHPDRDELGDVGIGCGIGDADLLTDVEAVQIDEFGQRVDDVVGVVVADVVLSEDCPEALALGDGDDLLLDAGIAFFRCALGDVRDVLGNDANAERGEGIVAALLIGEARRIDEGEGGDMGVCGIGFYRRANHRFGVVGRKTDRGIDVEAGRREIGDLHGHVAVDVGAVDLVVSGLWSSPRRPWLLRSRYR